MIATHSRFGKYLLLATLAVVALLAARVTASACSCMARPTVLDDYEWSDTVIITRLLSVEKAPEADNYYHVDGIRSATMVVEKVFKGRVKIGDEIVFRQGGGADCVWTFSEKWIGGQYLFYVRAPDKDANHPVTPYSEPGWWVAGACGRSNGLDGATEDLLYLENMSKLRGKTRISGALGGLWRNTDIEVENKLIKIIGPKKTYKVRTDKDGVFEIYDLPPGKYSIEPELPVGYKLDPYMMRRSPSLNEVEDQSKRKSQVEIRLEPKKHANAYFDFVIDNAVRGSVLDPSGKPMYGVCVYLWRLDQKEGYGPFDCTDEKGRFEITSAPANEYVVVANNDGKLSVREPFRTLYYPNVSEREHAAVVTIGPGETINDINMVVPKLSDTVTVEGVLTYSDGKPVAAHRGAFKAKKVEGIDGDVSFETDSNGRFSIELLKGIEGDLASEAWVHLGQYADCPKLESLIKKGGKDNLTVQTNVIHITAERDVYNLELTFPFPQCKEAKK